MVTSAIPPCSSYSVASTPTASLSKISHQKLRNTIVSALSTPYGDSSRIGLSCKLNGLRLKLHKKESVAVASPRFAASKLVNASNRIKPKVSTVCFGVAASQGALLLAGGDKVMRYSLPNSRIMIHQSGCGGHVDDVRRQVNEAVQTRFTMEFGLIDGVLETEY